ncbi:hypothetical protein GQ43DRAFT_449650 [Delitschia confertaspora ATCC 74209]|uniref:Uncharacterized protein n=1 Tax=Delitschia confertaspora ATCC 74209 TaxID=1513339 RepID=A0A9P4JJG2_9PLEO|nr:hypothetical protein GQ43DRAFT_449650 [Delitschia confertaspora ATCC 74209]
MYFKELPPPPPPPPLKRTLSGESKVSTTSTQVSRSSSKLLFGEIPLTPAASVDGRSFLRFWLSDNCRESVLSQVDREDLSNVRLVCHDFSSRAAPYLFEDITITFKPSSFTKPARMEALERIGRHVKTFTFCMPHGRETFLAPIIDPHTGEERQFLYDPQVNPSAVVLGKDKKPKYGTWEMTGLLIQQYPPLFHAATNIPAFIRAFSELTSLTHLKISCPGIENSIRGYRRSTVDYALISLRIAVERAPLSCLNTLSLLPIHPGGLLYLHPMLGFGSNRQSAKRWGQIRRLAIHMDSLPSCHQQSVEHLRTLHAYLSTLSHSLKRLFFRWKGERGPSPISLDQEPCMQPPSELNLHPSMRSNAKVSGPRPLKFSRLRYMELENAVMDSSQISTFISAHRRSLVEFNFEDVRLRSGNWDEALEPLTAITGNDSWKQKQEEVMDVPLMLSPVDEGLRVMGPLLLEEHGLEQVEGAGRERGLSRWLSKEKSRKAKEQFWGGNEHMKRFLRGSVFPWR